MSDAMMLKQIPLAYSTILIDVTTVIVLPNLVLTW